MEDFLNRLLQEHLERKVKEREQNILFPSELGFCLRRNYYLYKKPKKLTFETLKLFKAGDLVHNWLITVLLSSFERNKIKYFDYEGKVKHTEEEFEIIGKYDDIIGIEMNGELKLLEFKTVRDLRKIKSVVDHHFLQVNFYMKKLGLDRAYIVYVDRRNLDIKVFEVKFSEERFQELITRAKILFSHLKENKLPVAEAKSKAIWFCWYCPYFEECEKDEP